MKPHVDRQRCVGCGLCKEMCPSRLFEMTLTKTDKIKAKVIEGTENDCIGCMTCVVNCDRDAIMVN
jgi:NAD-dependent dihydropyrimidine dehydrogenase PreA subunit